MGIDCSSPDQRNSFLCYLCQIFFLSSQNNSILELIWCQKSFPIKFFIILGNLWDPFNMLSVPEYFFFRFFWFFLRWIMDNEIEFFNVTFNTPVIEMNSLGKFGVSFRLIGSERKAGRMERRIRIDNLFRETKQPSWHT